MCDKAREAVECEGRGEGLRRRARSWRGEEGAREGGREEGEWRWKRRTRSGRGSERGWEGRWKYSMATVMQQPRIEISPNEPCPPLMPHAHRRRRQQQIALEVLRPAGPRPSGDGGAGDGLGAEVAVGAEGGLGAADCGWMWVTADAATTAADIAAKAAEALGTLPAG